MHDWERAQDLFELGKAADEAERRRLLAGTDPEVAVLVRELWDQQSKAGSFLAEPIVKPGLSAAFDRGRRIAGRFTLLACIGRGGMGEVYQAHDEVLDRTVAIKILRGHLASRPDLRARFEREAKAVSALQHGNICVLYDVGKDADMDFLVMEYLDGETLAERLAKKALSLDESLHIGIDVASALAAAHARGILHRDVKPSNIMLTKAGTKLMDFGLARMAPTRRAMGGALSPTESMPLTREGMIMGTLQYMAPEQFAEKEGDERSDLFALGAVLYEMTTGRKAFEASSEADLIAAILKDEPPSMTSLEPLAPPALDYLIRTCLAKKPEERWQTAHDIVLQLKWMARPESPMPSPTNSSSRKGWQRRGWVIATSRWLTIAGWLLAAFGLFAVLYFHEPPVTARDALRFEIFPPDQSKFGPYFALSPNGRHLAFTATGADGRERLWVRDMDALESRLLAGSEGASNPFWSPDDRFLGYADGRRLKKIDASGGPPQVLCEMAHSVGPGSWNANGTIIFGTTEIGPLWRVSVAGGSAVPVTRADSLRLETHMAPAFLPDGRHFIYFKQLSLTQERGIYVGSLDALPRDQPSGRLLDTQSPAVYAPSLTPGGQRARMLFLRDRTLMAQELDTKHMKLVGDPVRIAEQIGSYAQHTGMFTASANGILAYRIGGSSLDAQLTWYDRQGKTLGTVGEPGALRGAPAISPDGRYVLTSRLDAQTGFWDVWALNLENGNAHRLTFDSKNNLFPVWSPDGARIAFSSDREGTIRIYQKSFKDATIDEALDRSDIVKAPLAWARSGRYLIEQVNDSKTGYDIWVLPIFGNHKAYPYLRSDYNERDGKLSPNGLLLAYMSDETNRNEIYVETFPEPNGKWQVSTNGGRLPVWSAGGEELFFIGSDQRMMAVEVKGAGGIQAAFEAGVPRPLFHTHLEDNNPGFDVSNNGRFLLPSRVEQTLTAPITVVVNWTKLLEP